MYLINHFPTFLLAQKSHFECLYHSLPNHSTNCVFGSSCFPFIRPFNSHKLQMCFHHCYFLNLSSKYKGFICLDLNTGRIYISRHVIFNESDFPFALSSSSSSSHSQFTCLHSTLTLIFPSDLNFFLWYVCCTLFISKHSNCFNNPFFHW